jgi:hypothetical protein
MKRGDGSNDLQPENKKVLLRLPELMYHFSRIIKPLKHFRGNLKDPQRNTFDIIALSLVVLLLGGLVLFFTKDSAHRNSELTVELTCRDSDGSNTRTKGFVTYTDAKGKHVEEDYCDQTDKAVYEMTCHKTSFWRFSSLPEKETIGCPKGCVNGACIK